MMDIDYISTARAALYDTLAEFYPDVEPEQATAIAEDLTNLLTGAEVNASFAALEALTTAGLLTSEQKAEVEAFYLERFGEHSRNGEIAHILTHGSFDVADAGPNGVFPEQRPTAVASAIASDATLSV